MNMSRSIHRAVQTKHHKEGFGAGTSLTDVRNGLKQARNGNQNGANKHVHTCIRVGCVLKKKVCFVNLMVSQESGLYIHI